MITYNHAGYIAQALDSVISQKVNFEYEILVGEDCSTDGTLGIVQEYQARYPDRIRLITSAHNVGMMENFIRVLQAARGQYVALLEGDDYWTSPDKLQQQVDYLDQKPECALCFHNATAFFEDNSQLSYLMCPADQREYSTIEEILHVNFIPTCSVLYRNGMLSEFPEWYHHLKMGDWTLFILLAQFGKIGYLDRVMGAYRRHAGGAWTGRDRLSQLEETLRAYNCLKEYFAGRYNELIDQYSAERLYQEAVVDYQEGNGVAERYLVQAIRNFLRQPYLWQGRVLETAAHLERESRRSVGNTPEGGTQSGGLSEGERFLAWVCASLPMDRASARWIRWLYGEWFARQAFSAHSSADRAGARSAALHAIRHDWRLAGNRGLLSILFHSLIP